jgi:hypothetical protein
LGKSLYQFSEIQSYKLAIPFPYFFSCFFLILKQTTHENHVTTLYKIEDTQAILDIINFNILHSTALYDYNIRTFEQQKNILEEKSEKAFQFLLLN